MKEKKLNLESEGTCSCSGSDPYGSTTSGKSLQIPVLSFSFTNMGNDNLPYQLVFK